ncbi:MAG: ParA family protein [Thermodesulfobacteriota bacterium]
MGKIATLYNNKGGVSKTTTLFNLAVFLSQEGKRVLLVDCDPQCNITELFFASDEVLSDPSVELPGTSIYEALLPRFKGQQATIDPASITLCEHPLYPHLFLFRGDLEFTRAETYFGTAWNQAVTENIHEKNTYVVFEKLMRSLGEVRGFDFILCDVGPSTGGITRTVILACDELVVPLVPDRFCYQAVRLLGSVINEWSKRHKLICDTLIPFGIEPFEGNPKLAGTVVQNFKVHSGAKAKQSYVQWQEMISGEIATNLVGENGITPKNGFDPHDPYVASIRDVAVLAPVSQIFGRAIFDIQQEHTKEASTDGRMYYGSVWEPWVQRMREYREEISKIAKAIS